MEGVATYGLQLSVAHRGIEKVGLEPLYTECGSHPDQLSGQVVP